MQVMILRWWVAALIICCGPLLIAVGCNREDAAALKTAARLRAIAGAYLDFAAATGAGPASESQLRKQMSHSLAVISAKEVAGSQSIEDFFISARDGVRFELRYGLPISQSGTGDTIAVEQTGVDGTRYVAFNNGAVECIAESSLQPILGLLGHSQ